VLEAHLASHPWIVGGAFSLVDVALGVCVDTLYRSELAFDRAPYPHVTSWLARLADRPTWKAGR
jgi:glutathione S-transferase